MATNSCEDIVLKKYVLTGPQGEKGEKGDPGDAVSFPIEAINISVTNAGYNNLQEVLDALLYTPITFDSISIDPVENVLLENREVTHPSADFVITVKWSLTGEPVSQTFTGPAQMQSYLPNPLLTSTRSVNATMANFNVDGTFTVSVNDGQTFLNKSITVEFTNRLYWGYANDTTPTEAFIKSLPNQPLSKTRDLQAAGTDPGNYFWYAVPVDYGTPTFRDADTGLPIDMQTPTPFTLGNGNQFTNDLDHGEDYYLYRSTNILTNIDINIT